MASENDSYEDFDDSVFEDDEEILSDDENKDDSRTDSNTLKKSKVATWRKIEDYWDNYKLNKQINDDPYKENYTDYLLDGELN